MRLRLHLAAIAASTSPCRLLFSERVMVVIEDLQWLVPPTLLPAVLQVAMNGQMRVGT